MPLKESFVEKNASVHPAVSVVEKRLAAGQVPIGPLGARVLLEPIEDEVGGSPSAFSTELVPHFDLIDMSGLSLSSSSIVGKEAFVFVFFATWCELCAKKMPSIRRALQKVSGVHLILVSVDASDTWSHIPGFLREQRMSTERVVSGLSFPVFTEQYNPVKSIPLVAVVGKEGALVDYQIGLHHGDGPRLEASLRIARAQ